MNAGFDSLLGADSDESLLRRNNERSEKLVRPKSLPSSASGIVVKRESFIRQSFKSIRRSFSNKKISSSPKFNSGIATTSVILSSSSSGGSERINSESDFEVIEVNGENVNTRSHLGDLKEEEDEYQVTKKSSARGKKAANRSTSSVSTLSHSAPGSPMAPLQGYTATQSVNCLSDIGKKNSNPYSLTQSNSTIPFTIASKGDNKVLRQTNSTQIPSLSSSANLRSHSPHSKTTIVSKNEVPEKEKKRKEISSSRLKKFHRHFSQVSRDERVINYFSCALVSDILLQGHLYITDNYFAFYSNVFGYVTKVVIPTSSVTKISKEKVAKIIPNAVGVATADERHVFGSFLSRESAFRLMCSVCPTELPTPLIQKPLPDVEISEECSIEDDSSCSISGNESPPQGLVVTGISDPSHTLIRRTKVGKGIRSGSPNTKNSTNIGTGQDKNQTAPSTSGADANSNIPSKSSPKSIKTQQQQTLYSSSTTSCASLSSSLPTTTPATLVGVVGPSSTILTSNSSESSASSLGNGQTTSSSSSPNTVVFSPSTAFKAFSQNAILRFKFSPEVNIIYLGVVLSIILAMFSGFLLFRILDIEAKISLYRTTVEFNWGAGRDADVFAEALRWQKELQAKSTEEAQNILHTNLKQIAKVRRSLEVLSMLIHERSSSGFSEKKFQEDLNRDTTD